MLKQPFYNPKMSYEENWQKGPFGAFSNGQKVEPEGTPEQFFLGQKVFLPFGIAAGPLVNGRFVKAALDKGFDITTYKTVRSQSYPCHPWPNVVPLELTDDFNPETFGRGVVAGEKFTEPLSITNSFGAPSFAPDVWQPDLRDCAAYASEGQVVIGSFQGTIKQGMSGRDYVKDFGFTARLVKETGVKILEVNLSCPNEGASHLLCFDLPRAQKAVEAIKNEIGNTPLILKIAYFSNASQLKKLVGQIGKTAQAYEAINTIPAEIKNPAGQQALPGKRRLISGVCGSAIKWAGLASVENLAKIRRELDLDYKIIGVGGVAGAGDYQSYLKTGADAVMSATGAMWKPDLAQEIKKSIR